MKTPMQELIDKIQSLKQLDAVVNPIDVITRIVEMQLEKEKKAIFDAWWQGHDTGEGEYPSDGAEIYYNSTFKNK